MTPIVFAADPVRCDRIPCTRWHYVAADARREGWRVLRTEPRIAVCPPCLRAVADDNHAREALDLGRRHKGHPEAVLSFDGAEYSAAIRSATGEGWSASHADRWRAVETVLLATPSAGGAL